MLNIDRLNSELPTEYLNQAVQHAKQSFPKESIGVILRDAGYIRIPNSAGRNTHEALALNVETIYRNSDNVLAVVHSHTNNYQHASKLDMQAQEAFDLPFVVLCLNDNSDLDFAFSWGGSKIPDFIGRRYVSGVNDCYSIIRDFYALSGTTIPEYPRDEDFWKHDGDLYQEFYAEAGFLRLPDDAELHIGDCLLGSVFAKGIINHGAVYIGNDKIIHHLGTKLSSCDSLTRWQKYMTQKYRYCKPIDFSPSLREVLK